MKHLWAALSVTLFTAVILLYLWWGKFQYGHTAFLVLTYSICLVLVISNHLLFRDRRRTLRYLSSGSSGTPPCPGQHAS